MGEIRPHGVLADPEPQFTGAVEGVCVSVDEATSTVIFTVPSYAPDLRYGPAPYVGSQASVPVVGGAAVNLPPVGARLLVLFSSEGRPWVLGWTDQP